MRPRGDVPVGVAILVFLAAAGLSGYAIAELSKVVWP